MIWPEMNIDKIAEAAKRIVGVMAELELSQPEQSAATTLANAALYDRYVHSGPAFKDMPKRAEKELSHG